MVMQVLGINYGRLRGSLVKRIGEPKVKRLEKGFDLIQQIAKGGLVAQVQKMMQSPQELQKTVVESIRTWVIETVVKKAVAKLVATFSGFGAIAVAAEGIYNALAFLIEKADGMQVLMDAIAASIGNIVAGQVAVAANYIESTLARSLSMAISFLARIVGLGNVGQRVRDIIAQVRGKIDAAVNKLVDLIVDKGNDWLAKAGGGKPGVRPRPATGNRTPVPSPRPATGNRTPAPSPRPATGNRTPVPSPRPTSRNRTPAPSPRPATGNRTPAPSPRPATGNRTPAPSPRPATGNRHPQNQPKQTPALASYDRQIGKEVRFKAGDENHRLWFEMQQSKPALMVASAKKHLETFLNSKQVKEVFPKPEEYSAVVEAAFSIARSAELNAQSLHQILTAASSRAPQNQQAIVQKDNQIEVQQDSLVPLMRQIFNKLAQPSSEQETLQLRVRVERLKEGIASLIKQINIDSRLKSLEYQAQAIEKGVRDLEELLYDPDLKDLEFEIAEQENQVKQVAIKIQLFKRINTLVNNSQSLLKEIEKTTLLNQYEKDTLHKPEPLSKDDRADQQRAQIKEQARVEIEPDAQKLAQETNNLKKLINDLDSLTQHELEIQAQENTYQQLKTKLENYKNLFDIKNSSSENLKGNAKLKTKEKRDEFRLVETMADYEKHYPRAVQELIDAAQESVTQLNRATARYGDGSAAYSIIAEQVLGSAEAKKFNASAKPLPNLTETHMRKCEDFITALPRSIRGLEGYVGQYLTQRAIDILRREKAKLEQAVQWVNDYKTGKYPELPSWADQYREQLRGYGLKERGQSF